MTSRAQASIPTLYLSHSDCELHEMGAGHPESPQRLQAIQQLVTATEWNDTVLLDQAPLLDIEGVESVHPSHHVKFIVEKSPAEGVVALDADTHINPHSINAALRAAGAAVHATDQILEQRVRNAFCAVRPPGHHAESSIAMGFCLFNSVALAVERALHFGVQRVAVLDFDVHHGNGTVEIFQDRHEVLVCSSFQWPFYPGRYDQVDRQNIVLTPLPAGTASSDFKQAIERDWLPAVRNFQPEMIFVSAGFDAHKDDPLGGLNLIDEDYYWISSLIKDWASTYSEHRVMSILEGGYDLNALARSVVQHIRALAA
ncbi:MAG: histone deacetylase family protein [Pseudomonadales bacterium]